MTTHAYRDQRDRVRASLLVDAARDAHHDVYTKRPARLPRNDVTVDVVSQSIRDLGVLLAAARTDQERAWLSLRLRNRLDVLDVLVRRGGDFTHVA